jgi:hypothetical protein
MTGLSVFRKGQISPASTPVREVASCRRRPFCAALCPPARKDTA